ncbi:hypothetical protein BDM02DRAFT_3129801 [Thelephora ganbajun]|uniref:Uncharacterized protein n=1 Tax=Thelephora ganbajun TaxID=370292 RepID=A0ACB6ZCL8_THEGA|nr:hypothetical protein BDM02DRAFT_3129801 [Thelephora ganbajun]
MRSPSLRQYIFSRVKDAPDFIPLLVYLHLPPTHHLTHSQADYWTQSLVSYYPESLKDDVLKALAIDPDRIIPLIPYILSRISRLHIVSESQIKDVVDGVPPETNPFVEDGSQLRPARFCEPLPISDMASQVGDIPSSVPSPFESERFYLTPQQMEGQKELPEFSVYCGINYMGSWPNPAPTRMHGAGDTPPSRPPSGLSGQRSASPESSFKGLNVGGSSVVGLDTSVHTDPGHQFSQPVGLWAEIEEIQNAIVFRIDHDMYYLSVPKPFILSTAYGFVLGAFSFLGLRCFIELTCSISNLINEVCLCHHEAVAWVKLLWRIYSSATTMIRSTPQNRPHKRKPYHRVQVPPEIVEQIDRIDGRTFHWVGFPKAVEHTSRQISEIPSTASATSPEHQQGPWWYDPSTGNPTDSDLNSTDLQSLETLNNTVQLAGGSTDDDVIVEAANQIATEPKSGASWTLSGPSNTSTAPMFQLDEADILPVQPPASLAGGVSSS